MVVPSAETDFVSDFRRTTKYTANVVRKQRKLAKRNWEGKGRAEEHQNLMLCLSRGRLHYVSSSRKFGYNSLKQNRPLFLL